METQAPALPVPPLPVEQKAAEPLALSAERLQEIRLGLARPPHANPYVTDYGVGADVADELLGHVDFLLSQAGMAQEAFTMTMAYARGQEEEVARLSRLLEEERRTVAELRERNAMLGGSLDDERRDTAELVRELGWARQVLGVAWHYMGNDAEGNVEEALEAKGIPLNYPKPATPTCQRDCQKCEKGGVAA